MKFTGKEKRWWSKIDEIGRYAYYENSHTKQRKVVKLFEGGYLANDCVDEQWLKTGVWTETSKPSPPTTGSGVKTPNSRIHKNPKDRIK